MTEKKNDFFVDSDKLSREQVERKHRIEQDPASRTNHMEYMEGMDRIESDVRDKVISQMEAYDHSIYTEEDVLRALRNETCSIEDFKALLSPAAEPHF